MVKSLLSVEVMGCQLCCCCKNAKTIFCQILNIYIQYIYIYIFIFIPQHFERDLCKMDLCCFSSIVVLGTIQFFWKFYILYNSKMKKIEIAKIQGWEFAHWVSEQIAHFLQKNDRMNYLLKKAIHSFALFWWATWVNRSL